MAIADNNRSTRTLYSDPSCASCHRVRVVVQEKQIKVTIEDITVGNWPEDVVAANPSGVGPTLIDRDLVLFDSQIIMEYFEDRFPHPALLPADPAARAQIRLTLHRIDRDWYSLLNNTSGSEKTRIAKLKKTLREDLTVIAPLFSASEFFMSNDFSLLDCSLAPLLWRLASWNIKLPDKAKSVTEYAERIFARESFQASLSEAEKGMR
ncbi:MAG: stringent starvation protein A [Chloroflexi bacterium]|nr:MAG: stringent starvation protein A [Chloroflexota bacterium]